MFALRFEEAHQLLSQVLPEDAGFVELAGLSPQAAQVGRGQEGYLARFQEDFCLMLEWFACVGGRELR